MMTIHSQTMMFSLFLRSLQGIAFLLVAVLLGSTPVAAQSVLIIQEPDLTTATPSPRQSFAVGVVVEREEHVHGAFIPLAESTDITLRRSSMDYRAGGSIVGTYETEVVHPMDATHLRAHPSG